MYSGYSPISSEGQHSEEHATQMDFDEKAERMLVTQSIQFSDDSSDCQPINAYKKEVGEKESESSLPSMPLSLVVSESVDCASIVDLSTSSAANVVTSQYSNTTCSADPQYASSAMCNSSDLVVADFPLDQSKETAELDRINEFDVNEAAKRLFIATNSPNKKPKSKQNKKKQTGPKMKSESVLRFHANYQRHPKPPYPYTGMIIHAIDSTTEKALTLTGIINKLKEMFVFFKGSYTGWKDSVRHNLSHNACFVKGERCTQSDSKGNLWHVDISRAPINCFKLQDTPVAREGHWAQDLHVQLGLPEIHIPSKKKPQPVTTNEEFPWTVQHVSDNPSSDCSEDVYSSYSPASDSVFAVPLSVTPASTTSEEFPAGPYNESLTDSREVPAFLSDTSFEDRTPGPIKTGKGSRQNRRYNPAWNKRNNTDVMETIARKAAKNVYDKSESPNPLPLCPSPQYPQLQDYRYPPNPYYHYQQQYIAEPGYQFPALQSTPGYEYPSAFYPYSYQSMVSQYPSYSMTYDVPTQNYLGHSHHFYQTMDYSPYSTYSGSSFQYQQQQTTDDVMPARDPSSQKAVELAVDLSLADDQIVTSNPTSEPDP
ncbi:uncharacterized protein LOC111119070 [Crassostrea virginica]